ncbi:hypothetical protein [Paenibacillus xylaniclasticus]|uniref:hypothetical protein n=1 Tax=Paenibacillus xylaniclasticus TaxID=588083 RepID=UPI000FD78E12|nr:MULTISPECIES: hypothetical protein [Paenibacillus]GFN32090.1 hypothetical protein PCURB6_23500 [Paenibacillus curdlanolyticus]
MNHITRTISQRSRTLRLTAASLLLAALMTTAACGNDSKSSGEESTVETVNTGGIEETANGNGETGAIDTGTASPESDAPASTETGSSNTSDSNTPAADTSASSADPAPQQAEGSFNGLADSHSAEITTTEGTFVYQLSEDVEEQVAALEGNAKVRFEYIEKQIDGGGTQRWLTKIEVE